MCCCIFRPFFLVLACAAGLLTGAAVPAAENYQVDPAHTSVVFSVSHLGYSFTYGRFNRVAGQFVFDRESPPNSQFALRVDASSVDTNDAKRDEHLRGPDFFNAKQFPTIEFRSTSAELDGTLLKVTGNLTLHGVTKQVVLPLEMMGEGEGPYGKYRKGFLCQFRVNRSEYGMTTMLGPVGDNVAITLSFEGIRGSNP